MNELIAQLFELGWATDDLRIKYHPENDDYSVCAPVQFVSGLGKTPEAAFVEFLGNLARHLKVCPQCRRKLDPIAGTCGACSPAQRFRAITRSGNC